MPLLDVTCPSGHKHEVFISFADRDQSLVDHGKVLVPCEEPGCSQMAEKDQIQLTGNNSIQWQRACRGQSAK